MEAPPELAAGIFQSLKDLLQTVLAIFGNRTELLAVEVREEMARWLAAFLLAAAVVALGAVTLALITFTIVVVCWEECRVTALVVLGALYLTATVAAAAALRWRLQHWPAFSATIAEFKKDHAWLKKKP